MYSADENALVALHKLRTHLGTSAEIETSKALLRSQGLTGFLMSRCCRSDWRNGTLVATVGPIIIGLLLIVWVIWKG
jgi:hypothetical protein